MRYLPIVALFFSLMLSPTIGQSANSEISVAIDQFVSRVYPKGSHYFWVINDTTTDLSNEIIIDIKTELHVNREENTYPNRFLLLLVKGKIMGSQQIPLNAKVDCHSDEQAI